MISKEIKNGYKSYKVTYVDYQTVRRNSPCNHFWNSYKGYKSYRKVTCG